jgi:hypothetical protein
LIESVIGSTPPVPVGDRCRLCAFRVAGATEAMADKLAPVGKVEIPQEAFSAALKMDAD